MHIVLVVLRNVIIEDSLHIVHVNPARGDIRCNEYLGLAVAESAHYAVTLRLFHVAVKSLGEISPALQLLGQLVHHALCVAEDERKLWIVVVQQSRENFNFVPALDIVVVLLDAGHGQLLFHNPDINRVVLILFRDVQNRFWHRRGKEYRLTVFPRNVFQNCLNILAESHVEHFVRLVKHHGVHILAADRFSAEVIHHTSRRPDNNLYSAFQGPDLTGNLLSAVYRQNPDSVHVFGQPADLVGHLDGQLPGRGENQHLCFGTVNINFLKNRNTEGSCLSGSCLGLSDYVHAGHHDGDCLALNRGRLLKSHLLDGPENLRI